MIKLHSKGTAPDYTEHGSVSTDCKTVGEFMTEAAAIYGGNLTIKVDGCRYDLFDNPKLRVADSTPIDEVTYASAPDSMVFNVKTKPEPKTVNKSGWVNLYRGGILQGINCGYRVFASKQEARDTFDMTADCEKFAVAKIEWEEVQE